MSGGECQSLLADYIRMAEQWDSPPASGLPICDDDDVPFADLLVASQADALITRDSDLLRLSGEPAGDAFGRFYGPFRVLTGISGIR